MEPRVLVWGEHVFGHQALADALYKEGVQHIFSVAAEDNMLFLEELRRDRKVRIVAARHEAGAVGMANGYSKATGRVGVCTCTQGPGMTNMVTALLTAARDKTPLVCITTEPSPFSRSGKRSDHRSVAAAAETTYLVVKHAGTFAADVQAAFKHARSGRGPVILAVPNPILFGKIDETDWLYEPSASVMLTPQRACADAATVAKAVDLLSNSEWPIILFGLGAFRSGAAAELASLAERLGALLSCTLLARGWLRDHPYHIGVAGLFGTPLCQSFFAESDCVLAVGGSLNNYTTIGGLLIPEGTPLIQIDCDAERIGRNIPVTLGIVGDAQAVLAAIIGEFDRRGVPAKAGFRAGDVCQRIAADRATPPPVYLEGDGAIDPRQLVAAMEKALPKERVIAMDAGHFSSFVAGSMTLADPSAFIWPLGCGSIGMGLFNAIGAAIGRPERPLCLFAGDGGFMQGLEELDTVVRERVPMTIVIMDDGGFGAEVHFLRGMNKPVDVALYKSPDFAQLARAFGLDAMTVRSAEDLAAIGGQIGKTEQPLLIHAKVRGDLMHEVWGELSKAR